MKTGRQIWLKNTKKFQLVRFVLFEKIIKYEELLIGENIFYVNGVAIEVYIDGVEYPSYKQLPTEYKPIITLGRKFRYENDDFWTLDFLLVWNYNFESLQTDSTILNLIYKRINNYKAYYDSLQMKQILNLKE